MVSAVGMFGWLVIGNWGYLASWVSCDYNEKEAERAVLVFVF